MYRRGAWFALIWAVVVLQGLLTASAARPAFPGQNGLIAFTSTRDGNSEIYTMNSDGSGQTNRTNGTANDITPVWSANGGTIAFGTNRDGNSEIYTMNPDGSGQTNLTNSAGSDSFPGFCPDGRIVFVTDRDGNNEIYIMNPDGSGQTNLTANPADDDMPRCLAKIAFKRLLANSEIFTMNLDGSGQTNVTGSVGDEEYPDWSPTGERIAFEMDAEVYSMAADGAGSTNLTGNPGFDGRPSWAPDNTRIAFESGRDGNNEVYSMAADGSAQTNLTGNAGLDAAPNWQPIVQPAITPAPSAPLAPAPVPAPVPDTTAPDISALKITRRFVVSANAGGMASVSARRGATVRYALSEDALVDLVVQEKIAGVRAPTNKRRRCVPVARRNGHKDRRSAASGRIQAKATRAKCALYRRKGKLAHRGAAGRNRLSFSGRFGKRTLGAGEYRIVARATDAVGNLSKPKRKGFRIVRGR